METPGFWTDHFLLLLFGRKIIDTWFSIINTFSEGHIIARLVVYHANTLCSCSFAIRA